MSSGVGVNAVGIDDVLWLITSARRSRSCRARRSGLVDCLVLLAIEVIDNPPDVCARLAIGWHAVILLDAQQSGVVCRQRLGNIVVIERKQIEKISRAGFDV